MPIRGFSSNVLGQDTFGFDELARFAKLVSVGQRDSETTVRFGELRGIAQDSRS